VRKLLAALLATGFLWSGAIAAQQKPILSISIEDPDQDALNCGVTKDAIESIAALTLRNNRIQVSTATVFPNLYVQTAALRTAAAGCAFHLSVSVRTYFPLPKNEGRGFKPMAGSVSADLCHRGGIYLASQGGASRHILDALEVLIKLCLGQLDY